MLWNRRNRPLIWLVYKHTPGVFSFENIYSFFERTRVTGPGGHCCFSCWLLLFCFLLLLLLLPPSIFAADAFAAFFVAVCIYLPFLFVVFVSITAFCCCDKCCGVMRCMFFALYCFVCSSLHSRLAFFYSRVWLDPVLLFCRRSCLSCALIPPLSFVYFLFVYFSVRWLVLFRCIFLFVSLLAFCFVVC